MGQHQGSVFTLLLFIKAMEALSRYSRSRCSEKLLYANDLVLVSETLEGLKGILEAWKEAL